MSDKTFDIDEKYSLSIYHFNLQYVAGNVKTYHHLHKNSMRPYLKFFKENPQWKASCEIQGHYLKFMQRYYPEDLELLRKLNQRDQLEMVSVHYSDQIYLAYPERDLQESIKINDEIFSELGLVRSPVWFGQENFFGQGIAERIMEKNGYQTALLNHHFVWHHRNSATTEESAPYWRFNGIDHDRVNFLISNGQYYEDPEGKVRISQKFSYWDDAELAFGSTPYAPWLAKPDEQYRAHYIKYKKLEKDGWKITRVMDYIDRVKELKLPPREGPYLTDGTWNIRYYQGVYLWMGTYRLPWEKDAKLRSLTYRVRRDLLATEKLVEWAFKNGKIAENDGVGRTLKIMLKMAWKHLLLAEVSDSTGQQPFPVEIHYTEAESRSAQRYIIEIKKIIKGRLQLPGQYMDTLSGKFSDEPLPHEVSLERVPVNRLRDLFGNAQMPFLTRIKKWKGSLSLYRADDEYGREGRHYHLYLNFRSNYTPFYKRVMAFFRDGRKRPDFARLYDYHLGNYTGISFPLFEDKVIYSPACMEDTLVKKDISEFDFKRTWLPLPNGLIGLGNDLYVIKHNHHGNTHIACTLNFENEGNPYASFHVLNPYWFAGYNWKFSVFKGSEKEALDLAGRINVFPVEKI